MKKDKIHSEKKTRQGILNLAAAQGCEMELRQILNRYDNLLKTCKYPKERHQIAVLGNVEVHKLLNIQSGLAIMKTHDGKVVGGEQIIPHDPNNIKEEIV